jgi:hypothetical protein
MVGLANAGAENAEANAEKAANRVRESRWLIIYSEIALAVIAPGSVRFGYGIAVMVVPAFSSGHGVTGAI